MTKINSKDRSTKRWKFTNTKGEIREKVYYQKGKNASLKKILPLVIISLKNRVGAAHDINTNVLNEIFYAEPIALHLNVKTHIVKQAFHKLNLMGIMTQRELWYKHEMHTRTDYGDDVVQWEAKKYRVDLVKLEEFYKRNFE